MPVNQDLSHPFNFCPVLSYHSPSLMDGFPFFTLHAYLYKHVQVFPRRELAVSFKFC